MNVYPARGQQIPAGINLSSSFTADGAHGGNLAIRYGEIALKSRATGTVYNLRITNKQVVH